MNYDLFVETDKCKPTLTKQKHMGKREDTCRKSCL